MKTLLTLGCLAALTLAALPAAQATAVSYSFTVSGNAGNGSDSFQIRVDDGLGGVTTGTVSLTVRPVNDTPQALSDAEVEQMVVDAIAASGAAGVKDMGKVMASIKPMVQGRADMAVISKLIKSRLA